MVLIEIPIDHKQIILICTVLQVHLYSGDTMGEEDLFQQIEKMEYLLPFLVTFHLLSVGFITVANCTTTHCCFVDL